MVNFIQWSLHSSGDHTRSVSNETAAMKSLTRAAELDGDEVEITLVLTELWIESGETERALARISHIQNQLAKKVYDSQARRREFRLKNRVPNRTLSFPAGRGIVLDRSFRGNSHGGSRVGSVVSVQ